MSQSNAPLAAIRKRYVVVECIGETIWRKYTPVLLLILPFLFCSAPVLADDRLSPYLYEDTKQLVRLVEDAATLMERSGTAIFTQLGQEGSRWFNDKYYIFVYDIDGVNVFHAGNPGLVGKNLMEFRDMDKKPVVRFITNIGRKPQRDANGWVFYLWQEMNDFQPKWKSTYIRKVVAPDGKIYLIGSGVYLAKIEKVFVQENILRAAEVIAKDGKEYAFKAFRDPASMFNFLDTYIYVLDASGRALFDPAFPLMQGRDFSNFKDAIGRPVGKEIIEKLRAHDDAWVQYLWPKPGAAVLSRKLAYLKRVRIDGETLILGSDFFLASPIWMKQ